MKRKTISGIESLIVNMKSMKFNDPSIDEIITGLHSVKINPTDPWEILQENYSKLKYFNENCFTPKFYEFMDSVDNHTIKYLNEIDFNDSSSGYKIECYVLKRLFEQSLNEIDILIKFQIVLKAYEILIVIVEEIRNEKFREIKLNHFGKRVKV